MQLPDETTLYNIYTAWKTNNEYQTELASAGSYWFWSSTEGSSSPQYYARTVRFGLGYRYDSSKNGYDSYLAVLCVGN